jgi:predicted O-methyltransferase YrrM
MNPQNLDKYLKLNFEVATGKDQQILNDIARLCLSENFPIIDIDVALFLAVLLRIQQFNQIIELGTGYGYSSLLLALCCPSASILTIESNINRTSIANRFFNESTARSRIQLIDADILNALPTLPGKYDFAFIDAAKESYMDYFLGLQDHLIDNVVVVTDDIYLTDKGNDSFSYQNGDQRISTSLADYRIFLHNLPGFLTTFLSVGCGVAVSVRNPISRING